MTTQTTDDTVPMPSVRMDDGHYVVLGTSSGVSVVRAAKGWDLVVNGQFFDWFPTKRAALQHCQRDATL
jgi:hypothetical protein